jgi:hypothetical protein
VVTSEGNQTEREDAPATDRKSEAAVLQLGDAEYEALKVVSVLFGGSPRRAKRFLNVYRICKARSLTDEDLRDQDPVGLLVLTALVVGFPAKTPAALESGLSSDKTVLDWCGNRQGLSWSVDSWPS